MNKTYRIVWNETTNTWVAVAEIAKAHGKSASVGGGIVASCTQVGARFAYTAAASAVLMMGAPAMAATGATGTDAGATTGVAGYVCYYDTGSSSVICGDATTTTTNASVYSGNPAKSVVLGVGAANTGESNVAVGYNAKIVDGVSAAIAIGSAAKSSAGYGIALGSEATATKSWDISIGRYAGANQTTTQTEGRNIAIGDGALQNAVNPNNNIVMGTGAGDTLNGTANVIIGTYANAKSQNKDSNGVANSVVASNVVAVGDRALATSGSAVSIGSRTQATGGSSVAIGVTAKANASYAIAQI